MNENKITVSKKVQEEMTRLRKKNKTEQPYSFSF